MLFLYAWYCALTRVSDYKHHPSDVLGGGVLGVVIALATAYVQFGRSRRSREREDEKREDYLL